MSFFGLPLILFKVGAVATEDMSDIQYLAIKEFDGKIRSSEGILSVIGDLATLTANNGKDMYLASAKITFTLSTIIVGQANLNNRVDLKINGVLIESARYSININSGNLFDLVYEFKNIGRKVLAGEIIKLEAITLGSVSSVAGFIECFEEDTGNSPQIPPLNPI